MNSLLIVVFFTALYSVVPGEITKQSDIADDNIWSDIVFFVLNMREHQIVLFIGVEYL